MKYTGDSLLGVSFSVKTPKPLDCRTVVDTTQELYTIPAEIAYEGMSVSNLEDGYIYMLVDKTNIIHIIVNIDIIISFKYLIITFIH